MKRYLWSYELSKLSLNELLDVKDILLSKFSITDIFLSMSSDLHPFNLDKAKLRNIIKFLKPINIQAMILQDNFYLDLTEEIKEKIERNLISLKKYNDEYPETKIKGIHIDVEPHTRNDFRFNNENKLITKYIKLIKYIRSKIEYYNFISDSDVTFTAATGWWYESRKKLTIRNLGKYLDSIVPMAYDSKNQPVCGSFSRIISRLPFDKWNSNCPRNSGYIVGLGLKEFENIESILDELEEWIINNSFDMCRGISLFSDKWIIESY